MTMEGEDFAIMIITVMDNIVERQAQHLVRKLLRTHSRIGVKTEEAVGVLFLVKEYFWGLASELIYERSVLVSARLSGACI